MKKALLFLVLSVSILTIKAQDEKPDSALSTSYYHKSNSTDLYSKDNLISMGYFHWTIMSSLRSGKLIEVKKEDVSSFVGWILASQSNTEDWFVRTEPVSKESGEIKIWLKINYKSLTINKKTYKDASEKSLAGFKCKTKEAKTYRYISYDSKGDFIDKQENPYPTFDIVTVDSVYEDVLKKVCELYNK